MLNWIKKKFTQKVVISNTIHPGEALRVQQSLKKHNIWFKQSIGGIGDMSYGTRNVTKILVKKEDEYKAREVLAFIEKK